MQSSFNLNTSERYASASDTARLERVTRFALSDADHRRLAAEGKALGVPVFSIPLTKDIMPLLDELFPAIKCASGDITFEPSYQQSRDIKRVFEPLERQSIYERAAADFSLAPL